MQRFLLEAKQELKKQLISEKKKAIDKAEEDKDGKKDFYSGYNEILKDPGNENLSLYAKILLPYWDKNPAVKNFILQMLKSTDKRLKYNTVILLDKNNKVYPDSLLNYYAALDDYRFELYSDLKNAGHLDKFPSKFKNHVDMGRSALLDRQAYNKPESIVYIDRLKTDYLGKTGFLYFYKFKEKKDDLNWRLAVVGLISEDPNRFQIEDSVANIPAFYLSPLFINTESNKYSFTSFSDIRFNEDSPVQPQLQNLQKRLLISRRKSGKDFYQDEKEANPYSTALVD
jgi:hypothetical protein